MSEVVYGARRRGYLGHLDTEFGAVSNFVGGPMGIGIPATTLAAARAKHKPRQG